MISKTDISITFYHKNYFELSPEEKDRVDEIYISHQKLQEHCERTLNWDV